MVIDHLHEDIPSLQSCALVCKQWLPSTRYHLFKGMSRKGAHYQHDLLVDFLRESAHIRPYICWLTLGGCINATTLLDILYLLPDLKKIRLFDLVVDGYLAGDTWMDDLILALLSMEKLNYLCIYGDFQWGQPTSGILSSTMGPSKLKTLKTYMFPKAVMPQLWGAVAQAKSMPQSPPLKVLDVPIDLLDESCDVDIALEFSKFLQTVGSGLKKLTLDFRAIDLDFFFGMFRYKIMR